jgi:hypothetical protein
MELVIGVAEGKVRALADTRRHEGPVTEISGLLPKFPHFELPGWFLPFQEISCEKSSAGFCPLLIRLSVLRLRE